MVDLKADNLNVVGLTRAMDKFLKSDTNLYFGKT